MLIYLKRVLALKRTADLAGKAVADGKVQEGAWAVPAPAVPTEGDAAGSAQPSFERMEAAGNDAKKARTDAPLSTGMQQAGCQACPTESAQGSSACNIIPTDALSLGEQLGHGSCGVVSLGRCV